MSLRYFWYGAIEITLLSEHGVSNDVFAKTHNLQRIYANRPTALLYVRLSKTVSCLKKVSPGSATITNRSPS